ncbi:hypothetical protein Trydic_g11104 [Trypoxylus dichotomus]
MFPMSEAQTDIQEEILQNIEEVIKSHNVESVEELCSPYEDTSLLTQEESEIFVMAVHLTEKIVSKMDDDWERSSKFQRALECSL